MSKSPIVSVVVATFNYGRYLPAAIESVLGQTVGDLELIVTDDGSTDNTPVVVEPYLSDSRFSYEWIDHVGVTPAKNHSLRKARGRYVAFLDSDDVWKPDKLQRQLALFERDTQLGLVYSRKTFIDPEGRSLGDDSQALHRGVVTEPLFLDNFICYSSAIVPRRVLDEVGLMDESIVHPSDYDLWLRIALRYPVDYVDEPLIMYRQHPGISRKTSPIERRAEIDRVSNRFLNEYGGRETVRPEILRLAELRKCCSIGWAYREINRYQSASWYLRAIARSPLFGPAWRGLAGTLVPKTGPVFRRSHSQVEESKVLSS